MKLFTAICFGVLAVLSFGQDTGSTRDTTVISGVAKVKVQSADAETESSFFEKQHNDLLKTNQELVTTTVWMTFGTWVLAIFAIIGVIFSWRTFRITLRQTRQETRAYMLFEGAEIRSSVTSLDNFLFNNDGRASNPPLGIVYSLKIKNFGKSAAYNVVSVCGYTIGPPPRKGISKELIEVPPHTLASEGPVGPGYHRLLHTSFNRPFSESEFEGLKSGKLVIYIAGHVLYKDIYSACWRSRFLFVHCKNPNYNTMQPLVIASEGNLEEAAKPSDWPN